MKVANLSHHTFILNGKYGSKGTMAGAAPTLAGRRDLDGRPRTEPGGEECRWSLEDLFGTNSPGGVPREFPDSY